MENVFQTVILAFGLTGVFALLYFALAGPSYDKAKKRRLSAVQFRHSDNANLQVEAQMRKAIAARKPRVPKNQQKQSHIQRLALRLHQSGKTWTIKQYFLGSVGVALAVAAAVYLRTGAGLLSLLVGSAFGAGIPHFVVGFLIKRRLNKFNSSFPDAIELLVRGLRSGLPVTETLSVVGQEISGPVGEEFRSITERIKIGRTMEDAMQETADRLGTAEFQFFTITLAIQRETGGNLAETLSNLAKVLRDRGQMKLKIRAMSSESKASAYIVGSLPFMVFTMIWWINPGYLAGFFSDDRLIIAGLGGLTWMSIGAFIMAKMVSFEI